MNILKNEITNLLKGHDTLSGINIDSVLERPPDRAKGDYALACFSLAKSLKQVPNKLASDIALQLKPSGLIASIQAEGGYINFRADPVKLTPLVIKQILTDKEKYGTSSIGEGKTIVIDYSSPNIAKPMGIGHLRSTVIGNSLYKIFSELGYKCIGINYLGDWGTQFGMLIADYKENKNLYSEFNSAFLSERYVAFNERAKTQPELLEKAREEFKKLESMNSENMEIWNKFRALSIKEFQRIYKLIGVSFDDYSGESAVTNINEVIALIENKGLCEISEGALIVNMEKQNLQPCLLKKSDGATLYAARDIAAAIGRHDKYKFHKLIYVVGADQKLHFRQFFKVLELMGYEWAKECVHVEFGLVRLSGEKMSTRQGKTIMLEEVLNEAIEKSKQVIKSRPRELSDKIASADPDEIAKAVGIGAIIFNDLKNRRTRDVDFNWEHILSFDGETGPYLQYTHTRLASLLEKAKHTGYNTESVSPAKAELLTADEEILLAKLLNEFPETIEKAAKNFEPSILSNYLLELSSVFNRFYRFHKVINDLDKDLSNARISLVRSLKYVLAKGLSLLGINPIEKM
ncbi:MAG: arginine--tRNA ligase [Planctomycetes bacterium]|nr:arginine--tRNA ligase [Planctomycetota bacterium]